MSYNTFQPGRYQMLPEMTKYLLVINGLMYLATYVLSNTPLRPFFESLALYQPGTPDFHLWQIFTSVFMHGSFLHLFSNMFSLWMFGAVIENIWGGRRFLTYYLVTAVGAGVLYLLVNQIEIEVAAGKLLSEGAPQTLLDALRKTSDLDVANSLIAQAGIPLNGDLLSKYYWTVHSSVVGASGAVFGIILAFGMMFPNSLIYLYFAIPIKAKWFVIGYGVFEFVSGISGIQSGIAHFAHVGGMLFGYLMIRYWKKRGIFR